MNTEIIDQLRELSTQRRAWVKATGNLERQIKAIHRRAPNEDVANIVSAPLEIARDDILPYRKDVEKLMTKMAKQLGVNEFVDSINGFGYLGLALIIGETGDLANYGNPGKLWKRMGLAVFDGKSQRKTTDKASAIEQGYSPIRRSLMFTIGDSMIKKQNEYRELYLERKEYEVGRNPEIQPILAHRRAQRYMEKRLLKNLWIAWRANVREEMAVAV